jgi:hypothetical protein
MFPGMTFRVHFPRAGTCSVRVVQSARAGARLVVRVDGVVAAERDFPAGERDAPLDQTVEAAVPAGEHEIRVENTGADWLVWRSITLAPYGPSARALAKTGPDGAVLWLYRSVAGGGRPEATPSGGSAGSVTLPGLAPGAFRVTWWDTAAGKPLATEAVTARAGAPLRLRLPAFTGDIAATIVRENGPGAPGPL